MHEPEPLRGIRVVADPGHLDTALTLIPAGTTAIRIAPDELFVVGVRGITVDDPHAIVEDEVGFVALTVERSVVEHHVDWRLPPAGGFAQGAIAGVPAKLIWLPDGRAWVVCATAYADELVDRLR